MKRTVIGAILLALLLFVVSCGGDSTDGISTGQSINDSLSGSTNNSLTTDISSATTDTSKITTDTSGVTADTSGVTTDTSGVTTDTSGVTTDTSGESPKECDHKLGAPQVEIPATCTEKGISVQLCKYCDYRYEREIQPTGHNEVIDKAVLPTCGQGGKTEGAHCDSCGEILKAQQDVPPSSLHQEYAFSEMIEEPTIGIAGSAKFVCTGCGDEKTQELSALTSGSLNKSDIFDVGVSENNPAEDNRWYIFDGKTETVGLWNPGNEWFGNVGDTLTVTLSQEVLLTDLVIYAAGNWTIASVTVRDSFGNVTLENGEVISNDCAFGGTGERLTVFEGKASKAYTIEVKILSNKDNYMGFKLTEMVITAAFLDTRLPHNHDYRVSLGETFAPTCATDGIERRACYCGQESEIVLPRKDHDFKTLVSTKDVECLTDGERVYQCVCGATEAVIIKHRGHIYERLKEYISEPTLSLGGAAVYLCVTCDDSQTRNLAPLALEGIHYLRVDSIGNGRVILKFNIYGDPVNYDVRYSEDEITEDNFEDAAQLAARVSGNKEMTLEFELDASLDNRYYVAVRPYFGSNRGEAVTIRIGGDEIIPIDYSSGRVYHGEVQDSFANLFDEQGVDYLSGFKTPKTVLPRIFKDSSDITLYGMKLSPIVDLEYMHYVSKVYLYYANAGTVASVRWSKTPVDFMADDSLWDGACTFTASKGWNSIEIDGEARYIQVIFKDGESPYEMMVSGYQSGGGDEISTEKRPLPTIGEMMGMCGFVAIGGGNTPIESVSCTTVLREYHQLEWTYNYNTYPGQSSFFNGWMGNFDDAYRRYSQAGLNVIPCFQWDVRNIAVSYKVDKNGEPVKSAGAFVRASFFEKFDPNTYFQYADAMFAFSARFGSNASSGLLDIAKQHTQGSEKVGLGYITWIELGNEPDGEWNGVDNYLSAYQLAALTSAGFDGHCSTIPTVANGYHLGAKNADPNMKVAMAGIADIKTGYIMAMLHWMKANRADGEIALDAFNVHKYLGKEITLDNGAKVSVGISPEEGDIVGQLSTLIALRDKYYIEREVWLSEFGWETNQSYGTEYSAHAYGEYTGRQVQAMWLTRTYLLLSAIGVDKATMFMCEDTGTVEDEAVGKFATSGVIGFMYDRYGNIVEFKKDSYYYLYTLKNTLGEYAFERKIEAYDQNVMIYEYKTSNSKCAYALWCPTSDGTRYEGYKLRIDGKSADLITAVYGDIDGVRTELVPDELGYVTVNVSENPVYVVVD